MYLLCIYNIMTLCFLRVLFLPCLASDLEPVYDFQAKRKTKTTIKSSEGTSSKSVVDRKENLISIPKVTAKTVSKKTLKKPATGNVLQVRAKAMNSVACCSKSLKPVPTKSPLTNKFSTKASVPERDNIDITKGSKRIKISTETESKWNKSTTTSEVATKWSKPTTSKADETGKAWKSLSRIEKKSLDPTRRKKLKVKPK